MMYEIGYGVHLLINQEKKERKKGKSTQNITCNGPIHHLM